MYLNTVRGREELARVLHRDPDEGNADGFSPKMDVGSGNSFYGCRAWQNSDDGWDGYLRGADNVNTRLENCWCFKNGFRKDGCAGTGNGNGFKMGGSDDKDLKHNFKRGRTKLVELRG